MSPACLHLTETVDQWEKHHLRPMLPWLHQSNQSWFRATRRIGALVGKEVVDCWS